MKRLALALLTIALIACSRTPEQAMPQPATVAPAQPSIVTAPAIPPVPASPEASDKQAESAWMLALFGAAYDAGKHQALVRTANQEGSRPDLLTLQSSSALSNGDVAIIVNRMPADEQGEEDANIATEGMLDIYKLRREGTAWAVVERHAGIASMGSMGQIGSITWVSLGSDRPGFVVSSHYFNRGYSITNATVFELGSSIRKLAELNEQSDNTGACLPDSGDCWDIGGVIRFEPPAAPGGYADMLVDFEGRHYRMSEDTEGRGTEHVTRSIKQSARYRFNGKAYALLDGANPVPDF